jgi:hypothetical protein
MKKKIIDNLVQDGWTEAHAEHISNIVITSIIRYLQEEGGKAE